jgi:ribosomal protein L29
MSVLISLFGERRKNNFTTHFLIINFYIDNTVGISRASHEQLRHDRSSIRALRRILSRILTIIFTAYVSDEHLPNSFGKIEQKFEHEGKYLQEYSRKFFYGLGISRASPEQLRQDRASIRSLRRIFSRILTIIFTG